MSNNKQTAINRLMAKLPSVFINAITTIVVHIVSTAIFLLVFIFFYLVYVFFITMNII